MVRINFYTEESYENNRLFLRIMVADPQEEKKLVICRKVEI